MELMNTNQIDGIEFGNYISLDIETDGLDDIKNNIVLVGIYTEKNKFYYLVVHKDPKLLSFFVDRIQKSGTTVIAHNAAFDLGFLYQKTNILLMNAFDTMVAHQICTPNLGISASLLSVLKHWLNVSHSFDKEEKGELQTSFVYGLDIPKKQIDYLEEDVKYLHSLKNSLLKAITELKLDKILRMEMRLLPVLVDMQSKGCRVDLERWKNYIDSWVLRKFQIIDDLNLELSYLYKKYLDVELKIPETQYLVQADLFEKDKKLAAGKSLINYDSSKQLIGVFTKLKLEAPINEKTGNPTTGVDAISNYLEEYNDTPMRKFLRILLSYREQQKLISTYGEKFLQMLTGDNYIRTKYAQASTKTGRLSSSKPNLQNIPGGDLRTCFIADPGHVMITCDMSSAEVRIAGAFSGEKVLIDAAVNGADMHSQMASITFSIIFNRTVTISKVGTITVDNFTYPLAELRNIHKRVLFAKFYKAGAHRIFQVLFKYLNRHCKDNMEEMAAIISNTLDSAMPDLTKFLSEKIKEGSNKKVLRANYLGRLRWCKEDEYGEMANFPIQATNADAMKIAMIRAFEHLTKCYPKARIVLNVHDEIVVSAPKEDSKKIAKEIKTIMSDALTFMLKLTPNPIPGGASVNIDKYWEK